MNVFLMLLADYALPFIFLCLLLQNGVMATHSQIALEDRNEQCSFPILKFRLFEMIDLDEPVGFEIILHSECRGRFNKLHPDYIELFKSIIFLSFRFNTKPYLNCIMKEDAYSEAMFHAWTESAYSFQLTIKYLAILKKYFKHPESTEIYKISLNYPIGSVERKFLNDWLLELQHQTLKWPFKEEQSKPIFKSKVRSRLSISKSKSLKSNDRSWSEFVNVHGVEGEVADASSPASDSQIIATADIVESEAEPAVVAAQAESSAITVAHEPTINFGHIYGWVSRKGNPIARNDKQLFKAFSHNVKMQNNFLGFASSKYDLNTFAKSSRDPKSFFEKPFSALSQTLIHKESGKNFAACRIRRDALGGFKLQAILKGDLVLAVLKPLSVAGTYDFKYPAPSETYNDFINGPTAIRTVIVPISASDIVLLLPRAIFSDTEDYINPYDILGAFYYSELSTFDVNFVQFLNFVHMRTKHHGFIAVGGFVHVSN